MCTLPQVAQQGRAGVWMKTWFVGLWAWTLPLCSAGCRAEQVHASKGTDASRSPGATSEAQGTSLMLFLSALFDAGSFPPSFVPKSWPNSRPEACSQLAGDGVGPGMGTVSCRPAGHWGCPVDGGPYRQAAALLFLLTPASAHPYGNGVPVPHAHSCQGPRFHVCTPTGSVRPPWGSGTRGSVPLMPAPWPLFAPFQRCSCLHCNRGGSLRPR